MPSLDASGGSRTNGVLRLVCSSFLLSSSLIASQSTVTNAAAMSDSTCGVRVLVDHHSLSASLDSNVRPVFGWQFSPDCPGEQQQYNIVVKQTTATEVEEVWNSGFVTSNVSANIRCAQTLKPATEYTVEVTAVFQADTGADSTATTTTVQATSQTTPFLTAVSSDSLSKAIPMWDSNQSAQYVLFRTSLSSNTGSCVSLLCTWLTSPPFIPSSIHPCLLQNKLH